MQASVMKTMSARERLWPDDQHRAGGAGPDQKHGRGVVMIVSVEEYERLSVQSGRMEMEETGAKGASKGDQ